MRTAYLECFSGISGDMMLGALVDAGVPFAFLEQTATSLNVGARLEMRKVTRGGIAATKVDVITPDTQHRDAHSHESHAPHTHEHHDHSHSHEHGHEHEHDHAHHHDHGHEHAAHTHPPHRSLSAILEIIRAAPLVDAVRDRAIRAFQLLGEAEAGIHSIPIESVHFHEVGAVDTIVDIVCSAAGAARHSRSIAGSRRT